MYIRVYIYLLREEVDIHWRSHHDAFLMYLFHKIFIVGAGANKEQQLQHPNEGTKEQDVFYDMFAPYFELLKHVDFSKVGLGSMVCMCAW